MPLQDAASGFFLGLSLIIAIGAQNAFVLQQGLKRSHVLTVSLACAVSDAVLIISGVWLFQKIEGLGLNVDGAAVRLAGACILMAYGVYSARQAVWPGHHHSSVGQKAMSRRAALLACLALSLLNPHVYLETVVLLGAVSAQHQSPASFGLGAVLASFVFFFALGYGARFLSHIFESPTAWRFLDALVAILMFALAAKLIFYT